MSVPCRPLKDILGPYHYSLKAHGPVYRTRSPGGFFISSNLTQVTYNKHLDYLEYITKRVHYTNINNINIILKLVPSIALVKKERWQTELGDAGTIDCFDLAFQYQIIKNIFLMDKSNHKLKILHKCIQANIPVPCGRICCTYHQPRTAWPLRPSSTDALERQLPHSPC